MNELKFYKANNGKHKYKVVIPFQLWNRFKNDNRKKNKIVYFGSIKHYHYRDSTPNKYYYYLDHNDSDRRNRYYLRHKKNHGIFTPDYFSKTYLW